MTLHLARAIQAANAPVPDVDLETSAAQGEDVSDGSTESSLDANEDSTQRWQDWRNSRRAIVHSVEISPTYSRHAEKKVVGGFRRGLYSPHIDFHVANVNGWIDRRLYERNNEPFLNYVFLDMPSCHRYLQKVTSAMKENGLIAVFVPSITQIGDCVREMKANGISLRMEKALELGDGISNGRLWDVRLALKKSKDPIDDVSTTHPPEDDQEASSLEEADTQGDTSSTLSAKEEDESVLLSALAPRKGVLDEEPVMVCRPKVGERVIGGGFVGLWRRLPSH